MTEPMISTAALFDLYGRIERRIGMDSLNWPVTMAVLGWCVEQGYLTPQDAVTRAQFDQMADLCAKAQERLAELIDKLGHPIEVSGPSSQIEIVVQAMADTDIPAGPQASSVKPDRTAGDLKAVADRTECEVKAPDGGEGVLPAPVDPSAPPVAGGGARPALWTPEEDEKAIAMSLAGNTAAAIAKALGRPVPGATFRLSKVLKARIDADRSLAQMRRERGVAQTEVGHRIPGTLVHVFPEGDLASADLDLAQMRKERGAESGGDCSGVNSGECPREAATDTVAADTPPVGVSAASPAPVASAPPFDPSQPAWWRAANANLNALGYRKPFSAAADLHLVEYLMKGIKIDILSADMRLGAADLKNRWRALLSAVGTPEGNLPSFEEQAHLLEILRARAAEKTVQAAE